MQQIDNDTLIVNRRLKSTIWITNLQTLIDSKDFEDLLLVYHMNKWETWIRKSFSDFKKSIWI